MPRASVSVRTVRTRRRGKKWSPVLVDIHGDQQQVAAQSSHTWTSTLCSNSANTASAPTATVIKCGNFKVSFDIEVTATAVSNVSGRCFIMFVPQGTNPTYQWPTLHPEYIMAWRSFQVGGTVSAVTIQSRLKRNLNSGDGIVLITTVYNYNPQQGASVTFGLDGACSYVCCAN